MAQVREGVVGHELFIGGDAPTHLATPLSSINAIFRSKEFPKSLVFVYIYISLTECGGIRRLVATLNNLEATI